MANKANGLTPEQIALLRATQAAKVEVVAAGVSGVNTDVATVCLIADLVAKGAAVIRKSGVTGARVWVVLEKAH